MSSVTIEGVPETISRADYVRLIESVGLSASDLVSLTFNARSIDATVFALRDGYRYGTRDANGNRVAATHTVSIAVVDD